MIEAERIVEEYIDVDDLSYAILISGRWGSGKTYFLKNRLLKIIESKGYTLVYVSLFGISSIEELNKSLFFATLPFVNNKRKEISIGTQLVKIAFNFASLFGKRVGNLKLSIDPFLSIKKGSILCFDDLERCSIPLTEVMGYISSLVEHDGIKTIIIASERDIGDEDTYLHYKEKLIGTTVEFSPSAESVIPQVIHRYLLVNNDFYNFLGKNICLISLSLQRSEGGNIRSLIRGLSNYCEIYKALLSFGEKYLALFGSNLLYFTLVITFEKELGILRKKYALGLSLSSVYIEKMQDENLQEGSISKIIDKYYKDVDVRFMLNKAIISYCFDGYLNHSALENECVIIDDNAREISSFQILENRGYWKLEQDDFNHHVELLLSDIKAGKFSYKDYLNIYLLFLELIENKLLQETKKDIELLFRSGLSKSVKDSHGDLMEINWSEEQEDFLLELKKQIEHITRNYELNLKRTELKRKLQNAAINPDELFELIRATQGRSEDQFFSAVDIEDFMRIIKLFNNSQLSSLRNSIVERYNFSNIEDFFYNEIDPLSKIVSAIDNILEYETLPLRRFNIIRIQSAIMNVITRLNEKLA